jgi:glycosyltransferase involved in cell wall biosynthesis
LATADILVVLPTLGERLETLKETFEAIDQQRKQVRLHLVVVCPAGAVEAKKLAQSYGATIVDDPKEGISTAINAGVKARNGEKFYAWMGDDDLFRPQGLATLQALLDNAPEAIVSYGGCDYITPNGDVIATSNAGKLAQWLLPWGPDLIPHPGAMIRLDALEKEGLFDSQLKYVMDLDMFLRLQKVGKFVSTRETVSAFRWHPDSLTVANRQGSSNEAEAVKKKHLPRVLQPISGLWHVPIRFAASFAANNLNKRARKIAAKAL